MYNRNLFRGSREHIKKDGLLDGSLMRLKEEALPNKLVGFISCWLVGCSSHLPLSLNHTHLRTPFYFNSSNLFIPIHNILLIYSIQPIYFYDNNNGDCCHAFLCRYMDNNSVYFHTYLCII